MLSKFSVRRPYTVLVAVVLILVLGGLSFRNMSMDFLPSMELPYAIVMTTYAGASPEEVERAVTDPVEQAMASINNVKTVQSMSISNMSMVILEFNEGTDMGSTTVDMRESLDMITARWDDTIGSPTIMKLNPDMMPIMVAAIDYDNLESTEVTERAESDIIPELESVEGVASVNASGQVRKKIDVIIQQDKIDKMNKKVQAAINGELEEAEKKLEKNKKKLEDGKKTLDSQKKQAAEKMAEGETQLNTASEQIKDGLAAIDEQIAAVKEQQKTLKTSEKQINEGLAAIAKSKTQLNTTLSTLKTTKTQLETVKKSLEQLTAQEAALKEQIAALGANAPENLKTALVSVQTQLQVIREQLKQQGMTEEELDTKLAEVNKGITQAESGLTEIAKQEKTLNDNKTKITTAKKKIASGLKKLNAAKKKLQNGQTSTSDALEELNKQKILSSIQLSVAEAQMNSGTEKIGEAESQLKDTKKTTKENAQLKNIITKEMVENILKGENFDMPSGYITEEDASYLVRVGDKINDVDSIQDLVICDMDIDGLEPITLGDVADVAETNNADDVYTVVNGSPAVAVTMQKQSGYSTGDVTDALQDKFQELEKNNEGLHISILMNQGVYIDLVVDAVLENLIVGAILAILILLFFLRDIRPTIIVACSIPLSVVAAIVAMYFSGVTLNIISLSGLALGVGMLVDNSVVVIENVFRLRKEGYSSRKAAVEGAKQVAGAIVASTLTTVCVFVPIIFTEGITRQLFVDLALTLAYTLGASLVVALSLVPAMSSGMIRRMKDKESRFLVKVQNVYGGLLARLLKLKPVVLAAAVVFLVLFAYLAIQNGTSMMPEMESTQMTVNLTTEDDKDFNETKEISNKVMKKIGEISDVEKVGAFTGSGSTMSMLTGGGGNNSVTMYVLLKEEHRELSNKEVAEQIEEKTENMDCELEVNASAMDMSALMGEGVQILVKGRDLDTLQSVSEDIMERLEDVEGLTEITNGLEDAGQEYRIAVDKAKAMKYALTVAQVYQQVSKRVAEASSASTVSTDTEDLGVYVSDSSDTEMTRKDLRNMKIEYTDTMSQKKKKVRLSKIATFTKADSPNAISHTGQMRVLSVTAAIEGDYIVSNVSADVQRALSDYEAPAGYEIVFDGEDEVTQEAMGQVLLMLTLGILIMYLIMVAQFQSLLSPFIILFTIPLAFTGGFMGLWISRSDVSVIAMIGFVMLSGIIVNNGIVLVDYTNQLRRAGTEKKQALVEAGTTRLRPILMTAVTTILGLIPMALGGRMGTDMTRPMAIVTIGGLIYGTLLTLFVVPCIYDLLNRKKDITEKEV
ncbi:MAG: efflux RND transporter permease subunit [Lachnospiraceae bacterium]|nr:efflux RND transporter permease subunit [Lachnospiraceae bacterium]